MGVETSASMDSFILAYVIRNYLSEILGTHLALVIMSDSKQLFNAVTCGKRTAKSSLRINISVAHQSYKAYYIDTIAFIRRYINPADTLTKFGGNYALWRIMESGADQKPVEQWMSCDGSGQSTCSVFLGSTVNNTIVHVVAVISDTVFEYNR